MDEFSMRSTFRQLLSQSLNLALPAQCPLTGEAVAAPGQLAPKGWSDIQFVDRPYCKICGVPFSVDYGEEMECPSCIADPPAFDRARAAVIYNDASHKLVVGFKHSDRTEMAPMFGQWLARAGKDVLSEEALIIPVPLHGRRLLARRYNQSALLAQFLAANHSGRIELSSLTRTRATPPQQSLSAEARRRNVAGAFSVPISAHRKVKGAHIILIDDVLTTGATLSAASKVLKRAGAAQVDALVIARVVKGGVGAI